MAKIRDIASTLFNLGKGMGLEKPRRGHEAEYNLNKLLGKMQERMIKHNLKKFAF